MEDSDDENPALSGSALNALKEFYADRDARQKQFEELKAQVEGEFDETAQKPLSMEAFTEDWNSSQFWYSKETATILASQLLKGADSETRIAVVSAPSVFIELKNLLAGKKEDERPRIHLLEFDERFGVFPEFSLYDYNHPLKLPACMKGTIDHIIVDPPFLSKECQTKTAETVKWLFKSWGEPAKNGDASKLIACTGERMEEVINDAYAPKGVATTTYLPVHAKGLSNEFFCYANFECEQWKWKVNKQ